MRWKWQRPRRDKEALGKALAEPFPESAADVPLRVEFGWGGAFGYGVRVSFFGATLVGLHFLFGLEVGIAILLITVAHVMFGLASSLPDFTNLNRALNISAEGVRLEKIHRSYAIPWWDVREIKATADLHLVRIVGRASRITVATNELSPDVQGQIVHALRARAQDYSIYISEWRANERVAQQVVSGALGTAGTAMFVAAVVFFLPGRTLGMRCSVNSAFLQQAFGTPQHQGCVVLRVSAGAEKAGIRVGDLVIEMEGVPVTSGQQYSLLFEESSQPWDFTILRKGEPLPLHFTVKGGRGKNFREDKDNPFFYYLRARWDADDKPDDAIKDYSRAIELEPRFDIAYLYRGELYLEKGDPERALRDFEQALKLSPGLGEVHSHLAYFYRDRDEQASLDAATKALELDRCFGAFTEWNLDCAIEYIPLASAQSHLVGLETAIASAEASIEYYPGLGEPYFLLAVFYEEVGQAEAARRYAREYLSMGSSKQYAPYVARAREIAGD